MMDRRHLSGIFITGIFLLLSLNQCDREDKNVPALPVWSSLEPLNIPVRQREAQYIKGNLVKNASFEEGRTYDLDSLKIHFNVYGWKKSGENVFWVNTDMDSLYSENEVHDGTHAIKIIRQKADETVGQGEGIFSDYIKVIPGNYLLSYDIRLENVYPNKSRMGTRVFDAIDVRVLYYDKNKLLINGDRYYPYEDITLDNTFKAHQFSNYWNIEQFDWATVYGRTCDYPYSEGDIPDEAKYVRIFLGMKGTGTMWVDKVDYRYSKNNFSPRERIEPLFDTTYTRAGLIIPTPKHIIHGKPLQYFFPGTDSLPLPLIYLPGSPAKATRTGSLILKDKLERICARLLPDSANRSIKIVYYLSQQDIESGRLIFCLGKNRYFLKNTGKTITDTIKDREQAYIIQADPAYNNLIYLAGNEPIGDFYAATTACQLLSDDAFIYHGSTIFDYPDYLNRPYILSTWSGKEELDSDIEAMSGLTFWKLNKTYISYLLPDGKTDWFNPETLYKKGIKDIGEECKRLGTIQLAQMVNPYYHFGPGKILDSIPEDRLKMWTHTSQKSISQLLDIYQLGLDEGATTVMLCTNDYIPLSGDCGRHSSLYSEADKKKLINLQGAHAYLINRIYDWLDTNYPAARLEFVPPWYFNEIINLSCGEGEQYLQYLITQVPGDVVIAWSGSTMSSVSVDMADIKRFNDLIDRLPMFWDNSMNMRGNSWENRYYPVYFPGKIRLCSLFEPFDVALPDSFHLYNAERQMFINMQASSEIARIRFATVADYLWNQSAYDPDYSIWKVLVTLYGTDIAREIILYNDSYFYLESICMIMEQQGMSNKLVRLGQDMISKMEYHTDIITQRLTGNQSLPRELQSYKDRLIDRFNVLHLSFREAGMLTDSMKENQ